MNFSEYSKQFLKMQNNYLKLDKIRNKLVESKVLSSVMPEKKQEYEKLSSSYDEINKYVENNVKEVKDSFIKSNNFLDYDNFKTSLTFFSTYSAFENVDLLTDKDYELMNKNYLSMYKDEITEILSKKKRQIEQAEEDLKKNEENFEKEMSESTEKTHMSKADKNKIKKMKKDKIQKQKDKLEKQVSSLEKEINQIERVLKK